MVCIPVMFEKVSCMLDKGLVYVVVSISLLVSSWLVVHISGRVLGGKVFLCGKMDRSKSL